MLAVNALAVASTLKKHPQRWKAVCAYDGDMFEGWQSQKNGCGVQNIIEEQLAAVLKTSIRLHGSGRTDSGVHALGQVFHFDTPWVHGAEKLRVALRTRLPQAIQIRSLRPVASDFHARLSARGKIYRYEIFLGEPNPFRAPYCWAVPRALDEAAMRATITVLRGEHDFKAFSAQNGTERETTVRTLQRIELVRRGSWLRLTFEANGFLYKMARSLAGTLVNVGLGKLTADKIVESLCSGCRRSAIQTAPAHGLFLVKVLY